jgi:hypothetical protein
MRRARQARRVAAQGGLVAHLRARRVQERLSDDWELPDRRRVDCHVRHRGGGAEPEPLRAGLDAIIEKACETHQPTGPAHVLLEQLHHVGAARDVLGGRIIAAG